MNITCNKCGHDFTINQADFKEIRRGDIIVQYFCCPACLAKYHASTANAEMRELIAKRLEIQNKIASGSKKALPAGTAQKLQHELNKVIARQKKLKTSLDKRGMKILKEVDGI